MTQVVRLEGQHDAGAEHEAKDRKAEGKDFSKRLPITIHIDVNTSNKFRIQAPVRRRFLNLFYNLPLPIIKQLPPEKNVDIACKFLRCKQLRNVVNT